MVIFKEKIILLKLLKELLLVLDPLQDLKRELWYAKAYKNQKNSQCLMHWLFK